MRRLRNVVDNVLRTNFYQRAEQGAPKSYVAIKLDSQRLDELPLPRPLVEIFVYAPEVEGVHLRFGKVARGGIRWSDRREDFRTEILGLVKAQQVKNAVHRAGRRQGRASIPRPCRPIRRATRARRSASAAYKVLIDALLDVTDNLHTDGSVVPPSDVVRHDGDDPYLVVAADKGTATFSDIANGIAESRGFWLGDAFASGGSHGYDHKKMGITARGAWEAVKRHFRELGRDIQTAPFTCVGVGDMSATCSATACCSASRRGWSRRSTTATSSSIPIPTSWRAGPSASGCSTCRGRAGRITTKALISKGGGVFARTLKEIPLTPEVKAVAGVTADRLSPGELIKALLKADVDLSVLRRHRDVHQGIDAEQPGTPATAPTTRCASTARSCAPR